MRSEQASAVTQAELPDKLYFKIGEVARIVGVKPYVLRYWETEFSMVKPGKTPSRHRLYRRRDVEMLLEIKRLLYSEGYTIAGAKKRLKETQKEEPDRLFLPMTEEVYKRTLSTIKQEILSLCQLLNGQG